MGTPIHLSDKGKAHRVEEYYNMAMGGVYVNGANAFVLGNVQPSHMTDNPIPQHHGISLSSVKEANGDITTSIEILAGRAEEEGLKMHVVVTERSVLWEDHYGSVTPNGQSDMSHVVVALLGDTLGNTLPALSTGETFESAFTWSVPPLSNEEDLDVSVILQEESSFTIMSALRIEELGF